eukprot:TRINITY_DN8302_c0_g1_i19.p1 TRINITY_DN8302_c0_g1~~TRINITY_DN8302_c0_g1_i19.p1  ORF type:complete len:441 (-),score=88.67 TRINITY_DN8302_c0_g1_i19:420-1742(-)
MCIRDRSTWGTYFYRVKQNMYSRGPREYSPKRYRPSAPYLDDYSRPPPYYPYDIDRQTQEKIFSLQQKNVDSLQQLTAAERERDRALKEIAELEKENSELASELTKVRELNEEMMRKAEESHHRALENEKRHDAELKRREAAIREESIRQREIDLSAVQRINATKIVELEQEIHRTRLQNEEILRERDHLKETCQRLRIDIQKRDEELDAVLADGNWRHNEYVKSIEDHRRELDKTREEREDLLRKVLGLQAHVENLERRLRDTEEEKRVIEHTLVTRPPVQVPVPVPQPVAVPVAQPVAVPVPPTPPRPSIPPVPLVPIGNPAVIHPPSPQRPPLITAPLVYPPAVPPIQNINQLIQGPSSRTTERSAPHRSQTISRASLVSPDTLRTNLTSTPPITYPVTPLAPFQASPSRSGNLNPRVSGHPTANPNLNQPRREIRY